MDIYPFKICGSGYDIISKKSGYDPFMIFYDEENGLLGRRKNPLIDVKVLVLPPINVTDTTSLHTMTRENDCF